MNDPYSLGKVIMMLELIGFTYIGLQHERHVFYNETLKTECAFIVQHDTGKLRIESESAWKLLDAAGFVYEETSYGVQLFYRASPQTLISMKIDNGSLSCEKTRQLLKSIFRYLTNQI